MGLKMGHQFLFRELENLFLPMLQNCGNMKELVKIQGNIVKLSLSQSSFLVSKMVALCDKFKEIDYATLLFQQVKEPNDFLRNALIRAYAYNHMYIPAIDFYKQVLRHPQAETDHFPDRFTFPFVVKSCAGLLWIDLGMQVHAHACKFGCSSNTVVGNSLIDLYTKCDCILQAQQLFEEMDERDVISWNSLIYGYLKMGQMGRASELFEEMPEKTIVSWTTMISGYSQIGCYNEALAVFHRMQSLGIKPDEINIIAVLPACAKLGDLELGKWIHIYADKNGFLRKTYMCNALIEMYAKCGCIDQALQLFTQMADRDVISWSTMIGGLANHGKASEAIELFEEMKRARVEPNAITFLGLLSACLHAGLMNEGLEYFDSMTKEYHIDPEIEHYGCLVDLLGRFGSLDQVLGVVSTMPMKPDSKIWSSLLSSCRTHCNLEIAMTAMEHLLELEPDDTGNYVLLSNIYAKLGKWDGVKKLRKFMRSKTMKKNPGCSLIEVNNMVQEFVSGDGSKPFSNDLFRLLELLSLHQSMIDDVAET